MPAICSLLVLMVGSNLLASPSTDRPIFYDYSVAAVRQIPAEIPLSANPRVRKEMLLKVTLDLDKKGKVKNLSPDSPRDSLYLSGVSSYLSSIHFEPARLKGKAVASSLPVLVHLEPRRRLPELHFPVDSMFQVRDRRLYESALEQAGFEFPGVEQFPPYFCDLEWSDTTSMLRYALLRLHLDEQGEVTGVEELPSSYMSFTGQLRSAVQYASFTPMRIGGNAVASTVLLKITFFPHVNYPTKVWRQSELSNYSPTERELVKMIPTETGLLSPPIPVTALGENYPVPNRQRGFQDTVAVFLHVDTSGKPSTLRISRTNNSLTEATRKIFSSLRFYPAVGFDRRAVEFEGLIDLYYTGSADVRLVYHWLSPLQSNISP